MDEKATLLRYLRARRSDLVGTLDGLSEYDVRRPMTPTGTNLLGLVKHVASVELEYFGEVFGRPSGRVLPWMADGAEPDADLWVPAEETRDQVVELTTSRRRTATRPSRRCRWTLVARSPGGRRSAWRSRCTRSSSTCASRPHSMPGTRTSSGSSSTGGPATGPRTRT